LKEEGLMVKIDVEACVGCGGCIDLCPATAITLVKDRSQVNIDLCLECFTCVQVCPVKAPQQI
jgi:ferredoxin